VTKLDDKIAGVKSVLRGFISLECSRKDDFGALFNDAAYMISTTNC